MADGQAGGRRGKGAEDLILRTIAAHADSLLRTARRYSVCPEDAQDAYQRALEIFMSHADRLDGAKAAGWLHVVVKREAQTIRRSRQRFPQSHDVDLDDQEAPSVPTPDERLASLDLVGRAAEALQRLKPQELRALWLKAQGHSYSEISTLTGWSYTKVNRCLTEGRRSFLSRYATIESGAECERWLGVISAMVDGEATSEQIVQIRPHLRNCPGCRTTLKTLQRSAEPLSAVLPIPLMAAGAAGVGDPAASFVIRVYEMLVGGVHDRAAATVIKTQAVLEASAAGKAAAIAGATAAVASGGYATVERSLGDSGSTRPSKVQKVDDVPPPATSAAGAVAGGQAPIRRAADSQRPSRRRAPTEFRSIAGKVDPAAAPEFSKLHEERAAVVKAAASTDTVPRTPSPSSAGNPAPEFRATSKSSAAPEFGP